MCVPVLLLEILLLCVCPLVHVHCYSTLCVYVHAIGVYRKQYVGCRIFWKGRDPSNFFFCFTRLDLCEFQLLLDLLCVCMVCTITGCVYDQCAVLQIYLWVTGVEWK